MKLFSADLQVSKMKSICNTEEKHSENRNRDKPLGMINHFGANQFCSRASEEFRDFCKEHKFDIFIQC